MQSNILEQALTSVIHSHSNMGKYTSVPKALCSKARYQIRSGDFEDGDTRSAAVGFLMEDALHGLGSGAEGSHPGRCYHKGVLPGSGADAEIDKNALRHRPG